MLGSPGAPTLTLEPSLRLQGGVVENPFYEPQSGRFADVTGAALAVTPQLALRGLSWRVWTRAEVTTYEDAQGWAADGGVEVNVERGRLGLGGWLSGGWSAIDAFPDNHARVEGAPRITWRTGDRTWLSLAAPVSVRTFPERDVGGESQRDLRIGGQLRATSLLGRWRVSGGVGLDRLDSNEPLLDSHLVSGDVVAGGRWGPMEAHASALGWWIGFTEQLDEAGAPRADWAGGVGAQVAWVALDSLSVGAVGRWIGSTSDAAAGTFEHRYVGAFVEWRTGLPLARAPAAVSPARVPGRWIFRYRDASARNVAVVGSFNGWQTERMGLNDGEWEVGVTLPPGRHTYAFVVDGVWTTPPDAEGYVDDGFGQQVGVVTVYEVER